MKPVRRGKALKRRAVYLALRALQSALALIPLNLALRFGRALGAFLGVFAIAPRRRARAQIQASLECPGAEASQIVGGMFRHLGQLMVELMLVDQMRDQLPERVELPTESESVLTAAQAEGRGVVAVTAHLGNWELFAQRLALAGFDLSAAARANPNPHLGAWVVETRRRGGVATLQRGGSPRGILSALRRGGVLAFLIDQDTSVPSVFVPFFGRLAKTPSTAARLAVRRELPVVLGFCVREGMGHRIELSRLSYADLQGSEEDRVAALTARMTEQIEAAVRRTPEQWVWLHERWKSRPPGDDAAAESGKPLDPAA